MTLTKIRDSFRWSQAIPKALQSRFDCGEGIAKSLTTRNRALAHSFATYLTETAQRMFTLVEFHPELNSRELGLLVRNLKSLTDIVEIRDGERSPSKYFTLELEHLVAERRQRLPSRRVLLSLHRQLHASINEFDSCFGLGTQDAEERSTKLLSEVINSFHSTIEINEVDSEFGCPVYRKCRFMNRSGRTRTLLQLSSSGVQSHLARPCWNSRHLAIA